MTSPTPEDAELRQAFTLFSETSEKLAETYHDLQAQIARLTTELAIANGELARRERLSALGEMAAQLAHQLRTPLAAALLYVGHLARPQVSDADRMRFAEKSASRLRHLERLIQDMLLFVKGERLPPQEFAIGPLLEELQQTLEPEVQARSITIAINPADSPLAMTGDRQAIAGALINLLENAVQASPDGACVSLSITGEGSPFAAFLVEDEGLGIPEEIRSHLFEPFFTTRGTGSGLGLAIVRQVAEAHEGWVDWAPREPKGSRFTLYLPFTGKGNLHD